MNRLLWAVFAFAASTSLATAADVPAESVFDWTGGYVGLNAGYGFSGNDVTVESVGPDPFPQTNVLDVLGTNSFDLDSDGFVGGAQIGYNWQMDALVLGIEADAQYADVSGSEVATVGENGFKGSQELEFFATLRARLGVAATEGVLIYGTGGIAAGKIDLDADLTHDGFSGDDDWIAGKSSTRWGWTAGAGAEIMVSDSISLKAEYLYLDFSDTSFTAAGTEDPEAEIVEFDFENQFHVVRAGLNWHFGY